MLSDDQRFIVTRMLTFDERKQDWLVQPFGLRRLERLDAIQAERVSFSPQHFKCYLQVCVMTYRKIPKISPGAYIFSKALFGGPIFGEAYIRRSLSTEGNLRFKLERASLIVGSEFTVFALFYVVFEGNFSSTSPWGVYIWRGDLTEGFLRYRFGGLIFEGLIHGGAYFRNFTVFPPTLKLLQ